MTAKGYHVYLCKFGKKVSYVEIEQMIEKSGLLNDAHFEDLTNLSPEEVKKTINRLIIAEKNRELSTEKRLAVAHVLHTMNPDSYFLILTLYEEPDLAADNERILRCFFGNRKMTMMSLFDVNKATSSDCTGYWSNFVSDIPNYLPVHEGMHARDRVNDIFPLDEKLTSVLSKAISSGKSSVKTVFTLIWGKILCSLFNQDVLLLEDEHDSGTLESLPILYDNRMSKNDAYQNIMAQFIRGETYDDINLDEIYDMKSDCILADKVVFLQNFRYEHKFDKFLSMMNEDDVYVCGPQSTSDAPLMISYNLRDDGLSLNYVYDERIYQKIGIYQLHKAFCSLLSDYMAGYVLPERVEFETDPEYNEKVREDRRLAIKVKLLGRFNVFSNYAEDDLTNLAQKTDVVHRLSCEEILPSRSKPKGLYFIIKGMVKAEWEDGKNYSRPISIFKEGDVFGIESLVEEDGNSNVSYKALSDDVVLFAINRNIYKRESIKHPELMTKALGIQTSRLEKFLRLWVLS